VQVLSKSAGNLCHDFLQVRAFLQLSCPTTTWAATIFDMYESTIDMDVKQQKLTQGDMSSVAGQVVQSENVGSFLSKF
jgi:hypothetical protein